ncbi:hypothetical protein Tco_1152206 [Tanacetum coccineum]
MGGGLFGNARSPFMRRSPFGSILLGQSGIPFMDAHESIGYEHMQSMPNTSRGRVIEELNSDNENDEQQVGHRMNDGRYARQPYVEQPFDKSGGYLFTTNILVAKSDMPAKQLHMYDMHVKLKPNEDLALLDANVTLRVTFEEKSILKLSPKLETFNLSSTVANHPISVVSTSTFKIMEDEKLMVLKF